MKDRIDDSSWFRRRFKRRRKLIKPRIQLRLIGSFVALSALGFLLQALFTAQQLADQSTYDSGLPSERIPDLVGTSLFFSVLCFLPLTIAVGILATFRLAGPIHRFEEHLAAVARGEDKGPCRIRKGDELQELCNRINEAVAAMRSAPHALSPCSTTINSPSPSESPSAAQNERVRENTRV